MKIKQLLGTSNITEAEDMTTITSKDYDEWCSQIGMKGEEVSVDDFKEAAWEVVDNDPKLGSASEGEKAKIVSKLWKIHQSA